MSDDSALPSAREIIDLHDQIEEDYELKHKGASVASPWLELRDVLERVAEYDDVYMRAAALLRHITTAHVFEDGNKRTAWSTCRAYLDGHGLEPAVVNTDEVAKVCRRIRRFDVDEIAEWLEDGTLDREQLGP